LADSVQRRRVAKAVSPRTAQPVQHDVERLLPFDEYITRIPVIVGTRSATVGEPRIVSSEHTWTTTVER
jgi:hypothetical protein